MKVVLQRVKKAEVLVNNKTVGKINKGILVFIAVAKNDTEEKIEPLVNKIVNLRIFEDQNKKMNLSVKDLNCEVLVVSEFTLYGNCKKGYRPDFHQAAPPDIAENLYNIFVEKLKLTGLKVETGIFREMMEINLVNDGPVTIIIEI